jgi:hypothetical protein
VVVVYGQLASLWILASLVHLEILVLASQLVQVLALVVELVHLQIRFLVLQLELVLVQALVLVQVLVVVLAQVQGLEEVGQLLFSQEQLLE